MGRTGHILEVLSKAVGVEEGSLGTDSSAAEAPGEEDTVDRKKRPVRVEAAEEKAMLAVTEEVERYSHNNHPGLQTAHIVVVLEARVVES